jgi:hypothetical protein
MNRISLILLIFASSCSSNKGLWLPIAGGLIGVVSGSALSPNEESKSLNTVTFGAVGLAVGASLLYYSSIEKPNLAQEDSLKERIEASKKIQTLATEAISQTPLPDFLKGKISPIVIEEIDLKNFQSEDGALHEPHKAYRIVQQPELIQPQESAENSNKNKIKGEEK